MSGGGSKSKGPMVKCNLYYYSFYITLVEFYIVLLLILSFQQILSTLKNSKFKSLPQNLQSLAALKRGGGLDGGGGVKKILPQVLKGIKSKM